MATGSSTARARTAISPAATVCSLARDGRQLFHGARTHSHLTSCNRVQPRTPPAPRAKHPLHDKRLFRGAHGTLAF